MAERAEMPGGHGRRRPCVRGVAPAAADRDGARRRTRKSASPGRPAQVVDPQERVREAAARGIRAPRRRVVVDPDLAEDAAPSSRRPSRSRSGSSGRSFPRSRTPDRRRRPWSRRGGPPTRERPGAAAMAASTGRAWAGSRAELSSGRGQVPSPCSRRHRLPQRSLRRHAKHALIVPHPGKLRANVILVINGVTIGPRSNVVRTARSCRQSACVA